jgi:hypothetical protein
LGIPLVYNILKKGYDLGLCVLSRKDVITPLDVQAFPYGEAGVHWYQLIPTIKI